MRRLQNVQGLRAIAAGMVIIVHLGGTGGFIPNATDGLDPLWILHPIGGAGVDLFFAISGLIMIVTTTRMRHSGSSAGQFLLRRAIRIYPPYAIITFLMWSPTLRHPDVLDHGGDLLRSISLWPSDSLPILFVGWTLTLEVYFYLIFALTILLPRRLQTPVLVLWAAAVIVVNLTSGSASPVLAAIGHPLNLEFLLGVLVGKAQLAGRFVTPRLTIAVGVIGILVTYLVIVGPGVELGGSWLRPCTVGICAALVLYGLVGLEAEGRRMPAALVRAGEWSFALYLIHPLVMKVMTPIGRLLPATPLFAALLLLAVVAASIVAAALFYRLVEQPLLNLLQRWTSRSGRRSIPVQPAMSDASAPSRVERQAFPDDLDQAATARFLVMDGAARD